jgi:FkbM family methyltransferase
MADQAENTPLPRENFRDVINDIRLDFKFRYVPFRGYYRFRSHKYMRKIDPEMGLLKFIVDPKRICLDVGANLGLFTYFLSRYAPHVYAFEPNPIPLRILRSVADKNVTVREMALSDQTGIAELVVPRGRKGWSNNGASVERAQSENARIVKVPSSRIDDLDYKDIGFIKIDVEGHEKSVLDGARETLARDRPNLFVENEFAHAGSGVSEVFDLMKSLDYDGFALIDGVLSNISRLSLEAHQINPRSGNGDASRYVKNFIFIPK